MLIRFTITQSTFNDNFQKKLNEIEKRQNLILEDYKTSVSKREEQINQLFRSFQGDQKRLIRRLDVSKVDLSMQELLRLVSELPYLENLKINANRLWCKEQLTPEQFDKLIKLCPKLVSLTLKHSTLSSEAFRALKQCSHLQKVDLRYSTAINGGIFFSLAQVSSLKRVNLAHCSKVDDQSLSKIHQKLSWEELNISNCQGEFSEETLKKIFNQSSKFNLIKEVDEDWG